MVGLIGIIRNGCRNECIRGDARRLARSAAVALSERKDHRGTGAGGAPVPSARRACGHGSGCPGTSRPGSASSRDDHRAHSTIRSYQLAVGAFCDFVCDPAYGWGPSCLTQFGSVPSQICRAENMATPHHRVRGSAGASIVDPGGTPGAVRRGRRRCGVDPARIQEGLGPGLP